MLENSIFVILALFLTGGSLMMLWSKQSILSAFGFLIAMLAMAGVFALLENSFLFLAQIMVSVGAVVVLSLMVIITVNMKDEDLPDEPKKLRWILFSAILVAPFSFLMYRALTHMHQSFGVSQEGYGTLKSMGGELFSHWVLPFEIASVLLLAAMVAAIVIARKEPN
ncbi:MAG: NADH-quinone oxidoreductase subunit J [Epsilonproteobacteria bacterium]|nr:MAG: NADH-quinone oxidoreductase subunit J [Campylobacterota bacterium]